MLGKASSYVNSWSPEFRVLLLVILIILVNCYPKFAVRVVSAGVLIFIGLAIRYSEPDTAKLRANYCNERENFQAVPPPLFIAAADTPNKKKAFSEYPGAVDDADIFSSGHPMADGLTDAKITDHVFEGNPTRSARSAAPQAAPPCIDDEADNSELDADERNTYQQRARNDATRVEAGIMNRRTDLDKYLREEVEEREDSQWWGRHEY